MLVEDLIRRDSIITSVTKAKTAQPIMEKLITKAKKGGESNKRRIARTIHDRALVSILMEYAVTRFAGRTSGFTRITKLGNRLGDATQMAMLSFVDEKVVTDVITPKKETVIKQKPATKTPKINKNVKTEKTKTPIKKKTVKSSKK